MKFMYVSIKYRYSDILLKKNTLYNRLFCCNYTCYFVGIHGSVASASRFLTSVSRYQSRSSMYIRGLIPRTSTELVEAVPIVTYREKLVPGARLLL